MKRKYIISFLFPLFALLTSCVEQQMQMKEDGYVDIEVIQDLSVDIVPVTKAEGEGLPIALKIVDSQGNVDYESNDFTKVNYAIRLETGKYTATASAGTESSAQVSDLPFYSGSVAFEVKPNAVSTVELVCRLTTVKVTAVVADEIRSNFDYTLEVSNGKDSAFFEDDIYSDEKEVYFYPTGKLTWTLSLTNNQGEQYVLTESYSSVKPQQHYAFAFSLEAESSEKIGAGEFKIVVDDSLNDPKIHDVTVVIDKSAPAIAGSADVVSPVGGPCEGAEYIITTALPFSSLAIVHSDAGLQEAGIPQVADICTDGFALAALRDAGVGVGLFAGGYSQNAMDASTTEVRLDFNAFAAKLPVGNYSFTISSTNASGKEQTMAVSLIVGSSLSAPAYEPWAKFVYVKGTWTSPNKPSGLRVQYRLSSASEWTDFVAEDPVQVVVDEQSKTYRMFICGLKDNTSYAFRVVSDAEMTDEVTLQTEPAAVLDNMSFDNWKKASSSDASTYGLTKDVWYPNASFDNFIWDTANGGTATIGKYPTEQETSDVVSGSAVKMTSLYVNAVVLKTFAAGNIYTGKFAKAIISLSDPGAELDWGVPFNGRPLALKGYYKYFPKAIDKNFNKSSSFDSYLGQMDKCQIQVGLFEWDKPFHVNTQTGQMVDFTGTNSTVVAYTKYESDAEVTSYTEFVVPFDYRRPTTKPTYAIVTACSSYLGDYFVGGEGSQLFVDEFSFVYDPMDPEFAEHRQAFFNMFK